VGADEFALTGSDDGRQQHAAAPNDGGHAKTRPRGDFFVDAISVWLSAEGVVERILRAGRSYHKSSTSSPRHIKPNQCIIKSSILGRGALRAFLPRTGPESKLQRPWGRPGRARDHNGGRKAEACFGKVTEPANRPLPEGRRKKKKHRTGPPLYRRRPS